MPYNKVKSDQNILDEQINGWLVDQLRRMPSEKSECQMEEKSIRLDLNDHRAHHAPCTNRKPSHRENNMDLNDIEVLSGFSDGGERRCSNTNDVKADTDRTKSCGSCLGNMRGADELDSAAIAVVSHTGVSSSGDDHSNSKSGHLRSASDSITSSVGLTRNSDSNGSLKHPFQTEYQTFTESHNSSLQDHRESNGTSGTSIEAGYLKKQRKTSFSLDNRPKKACSDSESYSGYIGSNSSNDAFATSSSSSSSSESSRKHDLTHRPKPIEYEDDGTLSERKRASVSSDLADFSTGSNDSSHSGSVFAHLSEDSEGCTSKKASTSRVPSPIVLRHHLKRKRSQSATGKSKTPKGINFSHSLPPFSENWTFFQGQHDKQSDSDDNRRKEIFEKNCRELTENFQSAVKRTEPTSLKSNCAKPFKSGSNCQSTPFYDLGFDAMAKILSYLHPIDVYKFVSMPLSKTFMNVYFQAQDLWKILCLSEPFYARVEKSLGSDDEDSVSSYPICKSLELKHVIGRYRLLYSSFIKCVHYLDRIQEDAKSGKIPAASYPSDAGIELSSIEQNDSLKNFFAKAHELKASSGDEEEPKSREKTGEDTNNRKIKFSPKKMKYGISKLTNSLLGPCHTSGTPGNVTLPLPCAIYSVVNWMVAFTDVPGIQLMCLKSLPDLLVDEQMRISAQTTGLTDIVLRAMVLYPHMVQLHTAAFHSLVLLARPLGGKEGMLFHSAMVNASAIFNVGSATGKSGIAIMLDSMKRFVDNADLQAMACWSMVNIALIHSQKVVLVRLGGITVAANAMIHHPLNAEVQFRAMFALINLVIPAEKLNETPDEAEAIRTQVADMNEKSELDMLNDGIDQVINLVVISMKNFCSSVAILNRACLVLHNLSLTESNHRALLMTPNCYQMIEWCIGNYRHDNILQQSARGTLQRLQLTLSRNEKLRNEFSDSIRCQM